MRFPLAPVIGWVVAQVMIAGLALGQGLTHGPVVGGVTASDANVFVRTYQVATVQVHYGTDPNLATYSTSQAFVTDRASDFTKIIPVAGLTAETTYYLDVAVNGVPQLAAPYPSFTTGPPSGSARNFSFIVLTDFTTTIHSPSHRRLSPAPQQPTQPSHSSAATLITGIPQP